MITWIHQYKISDEILTELLFGNKFGSCMKNYGILLDKYLKFFFFLCVA